MNIPHDFVNINTSPKKSKCEKVAQFLLELAMVLFLVGGIGFALLVFCSYL